MIVGFSKHGQGKAQGVLNYLLAEDGAAGALGYLLGENNRAGVRRSPLPVVVRGDPAVTHGLINSSNFEWRYTSGVLSFSAGERITPEMEQKIMDEFEAAAFAGLSSDRYNILWIRHAHTGREELHFVVPRIELATGKSLNIAPPGKASRQLFDTFRSKINAELGLSDPDDPARRRGLSLPAVVAKLKKQPEQSWAISSARMRQAIDDCIAAKVRTGTIQSREQVVRELTAAGFGIVREGADYLTVLQPLTGKRIRLRGECYRKDWNGRARSLRNLSQPDSNLAAVLATTLQSLTRKRAEFNQAYYGVLPSAPVSPYFSYDRIGNPTPERIQTIGRAIPATRSAACQRARGFSEATQRWSRTTGDFDRATEQFGRTAGAFANSFEATLTACARRQRVGLAHKYTATVKAPSALICHDADQDLEPEMEIDF